ncbi:MAG TPA: hypothetical protein VLA43_05610, partial [Longimicrobiales bacterium]|nr:hypothetical protein [Longimicrobiales bacterium]
MEKYGRLPRIGFINSISDGDYNYMTRSWFYSYRAIAAVADGLKSLANPEIADQLDADEVAAATAFAKFVQGMSHASVAVLFSKGFVVDENTDLTAPQDPLPYDELMEVAQGYFDDAIQLSSGASWTLPLNWMQAALTGPELAQVAYSMKARFAAANARTEAERQALNWTQIMGWIDDGIADDYTPFYDDYGGWSQDVLGYGTYHGWSQMAYFIYGMADQSGNYQTWNAASLAEKSYNIGGTDILIVTPDTRFPQGTTVAEQRADQGSYFRVNVPAETGGTWARPDRGTWRWSWYKHSRGGEYWGLWPSGFTGDEEVFDQAEIRMEEMNLLKAEGLYYQGDLAGAAALVNETRTAAGLNATDAAGTNTSCVPKLPNGSCGDLWEMLKWEKRLENTFRGPLGVGWYFDARGWGDLWKDTFLHLPIPCAEAQVLQLLPCESAGGPGGTDGAPLSTYAWNGEG